jgi:hypothetical protein
MSNATTLRPAMSLKRACAHLGLKDQRVRTLAKEGVLETETRTMPGMDDVTATVYIVESLDAYKARRDSGELRTASRTGDGTRSFKIKLTPAQAEAYTAWATANNMPALTSNTQAMSDDQKAKRKAYNAKRNAEKKAAREAAKAAQPTAEQKEAAAKLEREQAVNNERAGRK